MPFSSGTFSVYTPGTPFVFGTTIDEVVVNAVNNDFAMGLSNCVLKDGSQTLTSNIPFTNFKITGLGAGSALTDSATLRQVQYGFGSFLTSVAGTNTVTGTATPTPAYTIGQRFTFVPAVTNTGATTLDISSVGAGAIQLAGAALTGGELVAGLAVTVYVTAATPVFEIIAPTQFPDSRALVVGATDSTKKIRFEADELTTGNTRVVTMADQDIDLGTTQAEADAGTAGKVLIAGLNKISLGTEQATTSGTSIDFTGLPTGVRRITIMFAGVSTSSTSPLLVQIGDSGGPETTGYVSGCVLTNTPASGTSTAGFLVTQATVAGDSYYGMVTLSIEDATNFAWVSTSMLQAAAAVHVGAGFGVTSVVLDRVRITTVSGSDTFDAGAINIQYER